MVSFTTAVKNGFKNAFNFSGRATRSEFWWWQLFIWLIWIGGGVTSELKSVPISLFFLVLTILILIPSLSLKIRRLHDAGHSGWCILWQLVPYIGGIIVFIMMLQSSKMENETSSESNISQ